MILKGNLNKEDFPIKTGCFCALCGFENGYIKDRLLKLAVGKLDGKWVIYVSFACLKCGSITDFQWITSEDPHAWQASINLYGTIEAGEASL